MYCHSFFSFNKRSLFAKAPFGTFCLLSYSHSSVFSFFSLHSYSDRHAFLLKHQSSFPFEAKCSPLVCHHIHYNVLFVINSSTFYLPSPFFCHGTAKGCLVVVIYPCTVPVELNLYSPWHWNSSVHGLISALKDCRAAVIMQACLPVIGLINRLTDDQWLSYQVTVEEGEKGEEEKN